MVDIDQLEDPRGPLMEWLKSNPLFARAFVNRVWANYFNRGIVEPTDDMNLAIHRATKRCWITWPRDSSPVATI